MLINWDEGVFLVLIEWCSKSFVPMFEEEQEKLYILLKSSCTSCKLKLLWTLSIMYCRWVSSAGPFSSLWVLIWLINPAQVSTIPWTSLQLLLHYPFIDVNFHLSFSCTNNILRHWNILLFLKLVKRFYDSWTVLKIWAFYHGRENDLRGWRYYEIFQFDPFDIGSPLSQRFEVVSFSPIYFKYF